MTRGEPTLLKLPKRINQSLLSGSAEVVKPRLILIVAVLALTILGLVMVYSSSTIIAMAAGGHPAEPVIKQACYTLASLISFLIICMIPYDTWLDTRLLTAVWCITMVLLFATALFGSEVLGAKRWIEFGPVRFQPSELVKIAIVIMMARLLYGYAQDQYTFGGFAWRCAFFVLVPVAIILKFQSDLGTTAICAVGILGVLWIGEVPWRVFWSVVIFSVIVGVLAIALEPYRLHRLVVLDPYDDQFGSGYQLIQSFYAFGNGGLFGVGIGNSREKYLYLPEPMNDFIFAIIGEELGLIGCVFVIGLFVAVLYAGLKIARNAPDLFGAMIAGGCTLMLVSQAFLNIACVTGLLPTTGKPLPFVSQGGSAMLGAYLLVGFILSVSLASTSDSGVYRRRRANLQVVHADTRARDSYNVRNASDANHPLRSSKSYESSGTQRSGRFRRAPSGRY